MKREDFSDYITAIRASGLYIPLAGVSAKVVNHLKRIAAFKNPEFIDLRVPICDSMYKKRLHGYKAVGYSVAVVNDGIFAERTTETIFDSETFEQTFHSDLSSAKHSIIISANLLSWNRTPS